MSQEIITREPLVFISHDHREYSAAKSLADALSFISGGVLNTFYSSAQTDTSGIPYGAEWFQNIQRSLSSATDIVCILTRQSMLRPWIYFEAGFARGKCADTPIVALLIGVDSSEAKLGPFAQFKFVKAIKSDLALLLRQVATRAGFEPPQSCIDTAATTLLHQFQMPSAQLDEDVTSDALRAYRECLIHSTLTFGLLKQLAEHNHGDDQEIINWLKAQSALSPSETHRRRVLFSLQGAGVLHPGARRIRTTTLGHLIYDNLVNIENDPPPAHNELKAYRSLINEMNFVPKILDLLFTDAHENKMSLTALMKIVRGEWDPSELPKDQADIAFSRVIDMLRQGGIVELEDKRNIQLTRRGYAMCCDLFADRGEKGASTSGD